jgi:hypothetical protein
MKPTIHALLLCLATIGPRAFAHHSFAMYDAKQLLTVTGTVKTFQWSNPHVLLWLQNETDAGGATELWTFELPTSPGVLTRMGWTKHSLEPGDRITVEFNPLRTGEHGGSFKKATLVGSGKVLEVNIGPPTAKADSK